MGLFAGGVLAGGVLVSPAAALTLEEALAAAYVSNPDLQAERARVRAVDEQVPQALSGWRPRVEVTGSIGRSELENSMDSTGSTDSSLTTKSVGLEVTQPLFRGFRTVNAVDAAENTVKSARGDLLSREQDTLLSAAEAYLNVVRDQAVLELNINNEEVLRRHLEATRDRFEVGEITRTDVSQAESRLARATAARIAAEAQLTSSRATFERIVGLPADDLETAEMPRMLPESLESAISEALERQPSVIAREFAARAAQENIDVVRGELLPEVNLQAAADKSWEPSDEVSSRSSYQITAVMTVPLYQSGAVYSRMREAKHTAGQFRLQVDLARLQAREQTIQAWDQWRSAQAQIESIRAQVEAADVALEGVEREAQVGARTVLDVLDAEQELLDAQVELVRANRNERVAAYTLLAAVGRLTAADLGLPVDIYDPTEHYRDVRDQWFGSSAAADEDAAYRGMVERAAADGSGQ